MKLYLNKTLTVNLKQFINGNILWLFGPKKSLKTKIYDKNLLNVRHNYIIFNKLLIQNIYEQYNVIHPSEKKLEKIKKTMFKRTLFNHIVSLISGFKKYLRVRGVGYRFSLLKNNILQIEVGLSYNLQIKLPHIYKTQFSRKFTKIKFFSLNLQQLALLVSNIRKLRVPDIYKGKGIRFLVEKRLQKEGKKVQ